MPTNVSGHYSNMKSLTWGKLIYGVLTSPAPSTWKSQRCVPQLCEVPVPITPVQVLTGWGLGMRHHLQGALLEEPLVLGCQALSDTSLFRVRTWGHLHCPRLQVHLTAAPSFDGGELHGAMVSTCPWAAECAVPGLAEPAALPLCHLRNSTVLFFCWNVSYCSLEETHCFDLKK